MSDPTEDLLGKLEQATSGEATSDLEGECARLRESWLMFGKLVEAADAEQEPASDDLSEEQAQATQPASDDLSEEQGQQTQPARTLAVGQRRLLPL